MFARLLLLSEDGSKTHDNRGERSLDVLVGVVDEFLDARHQVLQDGLLLVLARQGFAEF